MLLIVAAKRYAWSSKTKMPPCLDGDAGIESCPRSSFLRIQCSGSSIRESDWLGVHNRHEEG